MWACGIHDDDERERIERKAEKEKMACLRSLVSPAIKTSLSLSSSRFPFHPVSGKLGLFRSLPKSYEPTLPAYAPKFRLMLGTQRNIDHNLKITGRRLFAGSFLGFSVVAGVMYNRPIVAYAMDDNYADLGGPSGFLKDDIHTFWSLARKFELPVVLVLMVFFGWRHPIALIFNIALLLLCTKPRPLSIYMFIEQLRQRDMRQDPRPHKTKFLYVKNVEVKDYKILCLAKVDLRDVKLDVIGILGGWWVFQTSRI